MFRRAVEESVFEIERVAEVLHDGCAEWVVVGWAGLMLSSPVLLYLTVAILLYETPGLRFISQVMQLGCCTFVNREDGKQHKTWLWP